MSTLRFDETTSDWVVFAPSRRSRPHLEGQATTATAESPAQIQCPFCPGNEGLTPSEIYSVRDRSNAWLVRVVPNKYPALTIEDNPERQIDEHSFQRMGGCGAHEVIVESPDHISFLGNQSVEQIEVVLKTLQFRYQDLMRDRRFQTVVIFKNYGLAAGTSLAHPHWQLLATPVVPRWLRMKHFEATEYFDRTGRCLYCVMLARELAAGKRILAENEHYVALLPYAGRTPFETWLVPKLHQASFQIVPENRLRTLAQILKGVLLKLYNSLANPAFNLTIDDVARGDEDKDYFLWHMRIIPRLTTPAGFELGSGMSINTLLPEEGVHILNQS